MPWLKITHRDDNKLDGITGLKEFQYPEIKDLIQDKLIHLFFLGKVSCKRLALNQEV